MSILRPIAQLLLKEHKYRPITGNLLTIGRQSVNFNAVEAVAMLKELRLLVRANAVMETDEDTVGSKGKGHITDYSFFSLFSDATLLSLDVSDYEDAAIIWDMNDELSKEFYDIADFVFDGSCLDNLFDPACAMRSMSHMLRPGGRMFLFNHSTLIQSAYLAFSPEWLWDFFEFNGYCNIHVFTGAFKSVVEKWTIKPWFPGLAYPAGDFITVAVAEKSENRKLVAPIQAHYRKMHAC